MSHQDNIGTTVTDLVKMAAAVDDIPTLEETDAMLAELRQMPRDQVVTGLINDLLEFRSLLTAAD
jgi:hypothetical protein